MAMTNAEWCINNGIPFRKVTSRSGSDQNYESIGYCDAYGNYNECYKGKRLGEYLVPESILTWLDMEHKEPILDEAERKYLSAVIRPFRDDVRVVRKVVSIYRLPDDGKEYISIIMRYGEEINFPYFRKGSMYKGMEVGRRYTLEELGL